ncbi:MAG: pilus assembly PilX N-terminal domain-containing protein [Proteobacteria bacterium]|nr:pilus assembly PilX N-terminal domain-containing protein [Pseudomonadota bacterium]
MTYNNEKGFVLPVGLMFLAILALLGTTAVIITTTDLKIGTNYKLSEQAFYVAEAGIQRGIDDMKNNSGSSFDDELLGDDGSSNTSDDGILSFESPGSPVSFGAGTYSVQVIDNDDGDGNLFDDVDGKVIIASTGTVSGAKQTINVMFGTGSFNPDGALGVYGPNNPTIDIHGNPTIDGWDYDPPADFNCSGKKCDGTINSQPGVVGIYTEQSSPAVTWHGSPNLDGDPNTTQYGGGNNTDWQAVANKLIPQADNTYTGGGNVTGKTELGNRSSPEITVVTTSSGDTQKFSGTVDGAGVLIIQGDGDVHFSGSFHWEGIVIVLSDSSDTAKIKVTGNAHVFGAFVSAGTATATLDFCGNPDIVYSSQALTYANDVYKIIYSWKDDSL